MKRNTATFACVLSLALLLLWTGPCLAADSCKAVYGHGPHRLRLATGSPGELGLLKALADAFLGRHNAALCWKKAGSGKSLSLLHRRQVDMVMVHAPAAEKAAVDQGWAAKRTLIGANEFFIVGPKDDPAGIRGCSSAAQAYRNIAAAKIRFLSRGDNSGTHKKEMAIWKKAGITPAGNWYVVTKAFMMATLKQAEREKAYFMVDSSTWVAGKKGFRNIRVLFRGDPFLINVYHALCLPPGAGGEQPLAEAMIEFIASPAGQRIIRQFGNQAYGHPLYNDAADARRCEH